MSLNQGERNTIKELVEMYVSNRATFLVISILSLLIALITLGVLLFLAWPPTFCVPG